MFDLKDHLTDLPALNTESITKAACEAFRAEPESIKIMEELFSDALNWENLSNYMTAFEGYVRDIVYAALRAGETPEWFTTVRSFRPKQEDGESDGEFEARKSSWGELVRSEELRASNELLPEFVSQIINMARAMISADDPRFFMFCTAICDAVYLARREELAQKRRESLEEELHQLQAELDNKQLAYPPTLDSESITKVAYEAFEADSFNFRIMYHVFFDFLFAHKMPEDWDLSDFEASVNDMVYDALRKKREHDGIPEWFTTAYSDEPIRRAGENDSEFAARKGDWEDLVLEETLRACNELLPAFSAQVLSTTREMILANDRGLFGFAKAITEAVLLARKEVSPF